MDIQPQHVNLETLFHRRLFRIPQYQRAYSWQTKHRQALFDDILNSHAEGNGRAHFMATIVGLRREIRKIVTDEYRVVEVVDGQQRITTLVLLYKAISKALDRSDSIEGEVGKQIEKTLVKPDEVCPVLLQTNHDISDCFLNYLRRGDCASPSGAKTIAERELLRAMIESEQFVARWQQRGLQLSDLVSHLKNKLTFILHEIGDEALVYTVFEVLNSRGLDVPWFDRLKSMLMAVVFESETGNEEETIDEVHTLWSDIYRTIGLRLGLSTESLRFAATLISNTCPNRTLNEENAARQLLDLAEGCAAGVIEITKWIKSVTVAVDELAAKPRMNAVTKIGHARLVAVAVNLRYDLDRTERTEILNRWENITFRIFGLFNKDARTAVGDFVRLAWRIENQKLIGKDIMNDLAEIGSHYPIERAVECLEQANCYEGWGDELRYFLYRYEEHLAEEAGQNFDNEQWNRIWESSPSESVEHILPKSSEKRYVHWLGNLILLPPGLNSRLGVSSPKKKQGEYTKTGLLIVQSVAEHITATGKWRKADVLEREKKLLNWATTRWAD